MLRSGRINYYETDWIVDICFGLGTIAFAANLKPSLMICIPRLWWGVSLAHWLMSSCFQRFVSYAAVRCHCCFTPFCPWPVYSWQGTDWYVTLSVSSLISNGKGALLDVSPVELWRRADGDRWSPNASLASKKKKNEEELASEGRDKLMSRMCYIYKVISNVNVAEGTCCMSTWILFTACLVTWCLCSFTFRLLDDLLSACLQHSW